MLYNPVSALRRAKKSSLSHVLLEGSAKHTGLEMAMKDLGGLITAACNIDSDIHNLPLRFIGATQRYLADNPVWHTSRSLNIRNNNWVLFS
jgi:hypothetical protein